MTKEAIYTELLKYINTLPEDDKNFVIKTIEKDAHLEYSDAGIVTLINLATSLKNDIRNENAKSSGKSNLQKAANDIIKSAMNNPNTAAHGAFVTGGFAYVCDGFRAIKFKTEVDLPKAPDGQTPMDMDRVFKPLYTATTELNLPDVAELKSYIKIKAAENKAEGKKAGATVEYDFGDNLPLVNAKYLLNAIEATGAKIALISSISAPLLFVGKEADAIICPINKKRAEKCA